MNHAVCKTCRWWHPDQKTLNKQGMCNSVPPSPIPTQQGIMMMWAVTGEGDSCSLHALPLPIIPEIVKESWEA